MAKPVGYYCRKEFLWIRSENGECMAFANRDVELASDLATNQPSQECVRFSVVPFLLMNWERATAIEISWKPATEHPNPLFWNKFQVRRLASLVSKNIPAGLKRISWESLAHLRQILEF